jgi:hypothetical protein
VLAGLSRTLRGPILSQDMDSRWAAVRRQLSRIRNAISSSWTTVYFIIRWIYDFELDVWYLISIGPQCSDWICWECYHHEGSSWSVLSGQIRSWNQARWSILSNSSCTNCISAHCSKAISLENAALIACLQVEHCIEEWSTGVYVKAKFEESTSSLRYMAHLEKLVAWRELNPDVVDKILATMYKRCRYVHVSNVEGGSVLMCQSAGLLVSRLKNQFLHWLMMQGKRQGKSLKLGQVTQRVRARNRLNWCIVSGCNKCTVHHTFCKLLSAIYVWECLYCSTETTILRCYPAPWTYRVLP